MTSDPSYYQRVSEIVAKTRAELPESHRPSLDLGATGRLKRVVVLVLLWTVALGTALYIGDYLVFGYRRMHDRNPYGSVQVDRFYAIAKKGGRTEFSWDGTESQTCVNALFPHAGYPPCWYARHRTEKRIEI